MTETAFYTAELETLLPPIPEASIVSRTFHSSDGLKAILFGFAPGQELSEHTAAQPAVLHFLRGRARVTFAEEAHRAAPGTWIYLPARLPHSVYAEDEVVMLLLLTGAA
jgi:quercetin dioxygenase-like cupin family protein